MPHNASLVLTRARAALELLYVADALSMPVHWFYNPADILKAFPGGITQFHAPPEFHPSSIMALHSTTGGGRGPQTNSSQQVIGDIILKGKRQYWGVANMHYHQGMRAGENTLNAHCARLVTRSLINNNGGYSAEIFLQDYINFMCADPCVHPDTYAESYHRAFFAQYAKGIAPHKCGLKTHDTPSVGGLVTIAPIAIAELLRERCLKRVQLICQQHLLLTHPDENLARVCDAYVGLIEQLLFRQEHSAAEIIAATAANSAGLNVKKLLANNIGDAQVVGGMYSKACYIQDSWPSLLFLLYKYLSEPINGLLANTNLGGENCHRGSVLGVLLGLASGSSYPELFEQLVQSNKIRGEISAILDLLPLNSL